MNLKPYLLETPNGYYFRMKVPLRLRIILSKREIKKSLKTSNLKVASKLAIVYADKIQTFFDTLKEESVSDLLFKKMVLVDHPNGTVEYRIDPVRYKEEMQVLVELGVIRPRQLTQIDPVQTQANEFAVTVAAPQPELTLPTVQPQVNQNLSDVNQPFSIHTKLSILVDLYLKDKKAEDREKYDIHKERIHRRIFTRLIEGIGDLTIGNISYIQATNFRELLKKFPRRHTLHRSDMTIFELIADTEKNVELVKQLQNKGNSEELEEAKKNAETLSNATIRTQLATINGLFNWINRHKQSLGNPFAGVRVKVKAKAMSARAPFTSQDLTAIFNDRLWTQHEYDCPWKFFIPLLLLYTGCRVNEIAQLEKKDILQSTSGIWYISINDDATEAEDDDFWETITKSLKTEFSRRIIPIHQKLITLGFLEYITQFSTGRIFPEIIPQSGRYSAEPSEKFNSTILKRISKETGVLVKSKQKVFYSFRHTALNTLKQQLVVPEVRAQLAGHSTKSTTGDVYGEGTILYV